MTAKRGSKKAREQQSSTEANEEVQKYHKSPADNDAGNNNTDDIEGNNNADDTDSSISSTRKTDDDSEDVFGKVDTFLGHVDEEKITNYINLANLDPSDYLLVTPVVLRDWVTKLIKARNVVMKI